LVPDQQPAHSENAARFWDPSEREASISATLLWWSLDISARISSIGLPPLAAVTLRRAMICLQANPTDFMSN
jgi:hypothetical protein